MLQVSLLVVKTVTMVTVIKPYPADLDYSRFYSALLVDQITKSGMKYVSKQQDLKIFVSKLNKYE